LLIIASYLYILVYSIGTSKIALEDLLSILQDPAQDRRNMRQADVSDQEEPGEKPGMVSQISQRNGPGLSRRLAGS
jgi:hypothetical protein